MVDIDTSICHDRAHPVQAIGVGLSEGHDQQAGERLAEVASAYADSESGRRFTGLSIILQEAIADARAQPSKFRKV